MKFKIHQMRPEHADGKGYVHWKSWQETYPGLVDAGYLSRLTLEKCQNIAHRWPENTLIAELDGKIVGFACYGNSSEPDMPGCGEVYAVYILKEAQGLGLGRELMDAALEQLAQFDTVFLWVLKRNEPAIGFYSHYGFRFDGTEKEILLGTPNTELRMTYTRHSPSFHQ